MADKSFLKRSIENLLRGVGLAFLCMIFAFWISNSSETLSWTRWIFIIVGLLNLIDGLLHIKDIWNALWDIKGPSH